jgi:hypothetical protein
MANNIIYSGTALTTIFQPTNPGNTSVYTLVSTNIKANGLDINTIFSPRDNKVSNEAVVSFPGSITSGGIHLNKLFNKLDATYDITVGGAVPYTSNVRNTGITYSGKNPSTNGVDAPNFTVPNPSVDTTSTIKTTCTLAGAYSNFGIVSSQSPPNTTYYTITSQSGPVGGGALVLRLPGNYQPGTISGSFNISTVTATTGQTYITFSGRQYSCSITNITFSPTVSPLPTYTYAWTQVSGPTPVTFSSTTTSNVTVSGLGPPIAPPNSTSGIQCKITYTGGGGATGSGEIIKTFSLTWTPM